MGDFHWAMSEDQFLDAESEYSGGKDGPLSFQLIVLTHLKKIAQLTCTEWHGGYWQEKYKVVGGVGHSERYYIQDSREVFWNAVHGLYDLIFPYFDHQMSKESESTLEKLNNMKLPENKLEVNDWDRNKMVLMRELFRSLTSFLKRKDYFNSMRLEE